MASSTECSLSDKLLGEEKKAFLTDVRCDLLRSIEVQGRVGFWAELRRLEVVDDEAKQTIELNRMNTNVQQVDMLLDRVLKGTYGRYYRFCQALIHDQQEFVVYEILKEDIEEIKRMK